MLIIFFINLTQMKSKKKKLNNKKKKLNNKKKKIAQLGK